MLRQSIASCAALALAAVACSSSDNASNPRTLRDTTGVAFGWNCHDTCNVVGPPGVAVPADCGPDPHWDYANFRVLLVCLYTTQTHQQVAGPFSVSDFCRAVTCDSDAQCPKFAEGSFVCTRGLCQRPASSGSQVNQDEALSLCLQDVPRAVSCAAAVNDTATTQARTDVEALCARPAEWVGSTDGLELDCTVPAWCRQP